MNLVLLTAALLSQFQWQDGNHAVTATRVADDLAGLHAVELHFPATGQHTRAYVDHRLVVQPNTSLKLPWEALGLRAVRALMPSRNLWLVESADGKDALETLARLQAQHAEKYFNILSPDLYLRHTRHALDTPPNDPRYGGQWYLERLDMEAAWRLSSGAESTTIVVVDNGCDTTHPDLVDKLDEGLDVVDGDTDPSFEPQRNGNNHGTACASLVAASTNNSVGIAGACPDCRLRCVRLLSDNPQGTPLSADVAAFTFALNTNAAVVSNSWGFVDAIPVPAALAEAIEEVVDVGRDGLGALVLFAAGNENRLVGTDELLGVRGVIGIGAITLYEDATSFTNRGPDVDLVAPTGTLAADIAGVDGDDPADFTTRFGGTSSACPVAAGVAALLVSAAPQTRGEDLAAMFINTARQSPYATPDEHGHDDVYGRGVMAPAAALRLALNLPEELPDAGVTPDASAAGPGAGGDTPAPPSGPGCRCAVLADPAFPLAALLLAGLARRRR